MTNLLLNTTTEFIRLDKGNAQLALLVARAVPDLQARFLKAVRERVERCLRDLAGSHRHWHLEERWGGRPKNFERLRLYKKQHWSSDSGNAGIWLRWEEHQAGDGSLWCVGVEGHNAAAPNLSEEDLRGCYPSGAAGPDQGGWFCGSPCGKAWIGWDRLLCKTDDEIGRFVESTVDLMTKLTRVIDAADSGQRKGGSPPGHK